ncbi:antibiotic biosynthesis monooxygenase family protein [Viridibacillus arvi]|uniref:antibiotic biosynthesis monooxygenase family protein n=1 Tax=Viridibacillus arvi TaxID=263475 RepID=UPI0036E90950
MFYQAKRIIVQEGFSGQVVERFSGDTPLAKQPGFIDMKVLVKKVRRGDEEVMILVQWQSEEDWKNWEKSPEHIAGHKANIGKPKPEYIIETSQNVYEVKATK